jgi:hypothetical protein
LKRFITLLMLALCLSAFAAPTASAAIPTTPFTAVNCQQSGYNTLQAGERLSHFGNAIDGVGAYLTLYGPVNNCIDTTGLDAHSGTSFWIAIQPVSQGLDDNQIVQLGMMKCDTVIGSPYGTDPCGIPPGGHNGEWRWFYAFGGCNGNVPWARDLGPVGTSAYNTTHKLRILHNASYIYFYIGDEEVAQISYSQMSCWGAHADNRSFAACEVFDSGDSCGGSSGGSGFGGDLARFSVLSQRRASDDYWYTNQLVTDPCYTIERARFHCDPVYYTDPGNNELWLWSTTN